MTPAPPPPAGSDDPALAPASGPLTTVSCNLWATDAVAFKGVKASIRGRTDRLDVQFDPRNQTLVTMFLIQMMDPGRRSVMSPMLDAVVKIAEPRDGKHRYAAYTIANDLTAVADFGASKADFDKQVRAVRGVALPTQLYKGALEAIAKLAKEKADRKALVILGDGNSDDTELRARAGREGRQGRRRDHPCPGLRSGREPTSPSSRTSAAWPTTPAGFAGRSGSAARRNIPLATSSSPRRWRTAAPLPSASRSRPAPRR